MGTQGISGNSELIIRVLSPPPQTHSNNLTPPASPPAPSPLSSPAHTPATPAPPSKLNWPAVT